MFFFIKQKTAYGKRISDWSSGVCSSDLRPTAEIQSASTPPPCPPNASIAMVMRWRLSSASVIVRSLESAAQERPLRPPLQGANQTAAHRVADPVPAGRMDREVGGWGQSVGVRVDIGGSRVVTHKK